MNPLSDGFPTALTVGGVDYEIDSDFHTALTIMEAFEDPSLTWLDKQEIAIDFLYGENQPPDRAEAFELARLFLDCGEERQTAEDDGPDLGRLYSFSHDGKFIYSAIRRSHGIDLDTVGYLHWWKFCYLLQDLSEDCYFQRMLSLRARRALGKLTKEEKEEWRRNADILTLPEYRDPEAEAANDAFMARYNEAARRRKAEQ